MLTADYSAGACEFAVACVGVVLTAAHMEHTITIVPVTQALQDLHCWSFWSSPLSSPSRRAVSTWEGWSPFCPSLRETSVPPGLGGPCWTFSVQSPTLSLSLSLSSPSSPWRVAHCTEDWQCSRVLTLAADQSLSSRGVRRTNRLLRQSGNSLARLVDTQANTVSTTGGQQATHTYIIIYHVHEGTFTLTIFSLYRRVIGNINIPRFLPKYIAFDLLVSDNGKGWHDTRKYIIHIILFLSLKRSHVHNNSFKIFFKLKFSVWYNLRYLY